MNPDCVRSGYGRPFGPTIGEEPGDRERSARVAARVLGRPRRSLRYASDVVGIPIIFRWKPTFVLRGLEALRVRV